MAAYTFDISELFTRILKYLLLGTVVAIVAYLLPNKNLSTESAILLGLTAAAIFSLLDVFLPSVGSSARFGLGAYSGAALLM